jgi:hypothetical protein
MNRNNLAALLMMLSGAIAGCTITMSDAAKPPAHPEMHERYLGAGMYRYGRHDHFHPGRKPPEEQENEKTGKKSGKGLKR